MAQTNVNIRMDENLKKQFDTFCENTGMTMTTAICIFVKKVVSEQKIPFEITANDPIYSENSVKQIKAISKEMDEGKYYEVDLGEVKNEKKPNKTIRRSKKEL